MEERISTWRPGIWRTEVDLRVQELWRRLRVAESLAPGERAEAGRELSEEVTAAITGNLRSAEKAIAERPRFRERLLPWWTGSAITAAWEPVHEAERLLLPMERKTTVKSRLAWLLSWVRRAMTEGPQRMEHEETLKGQMESEALDMPSVEAILTAVTEANHERYGNLRSFRNNLVLVTGMLALLVAVLGFWQLLSPGTVSFCTGGEEATTCFGGADEPRSGDVWLVALFGAIGGLLALAFGLAQTENPPSRYDPRIWQVGLKAAAGSATAISGVLLVQADLVVAPASSPSEALYLVYAVVFGFSQQLFTRVVDKQAGRLIEPGGDSPAHSSGSASVPRTGTSSAGRISASSSPSSAMRRP